MLEIGRQTFFATFGEKYLHAYDDKFLALHSDVVWSRFLVVPPSDVASAHFETMLVRNDELESTLNRVTIPMKQFERSTVQDAMEHLEHLGKRITSTTPMLITILAMERQTRVTVRDWFVQNMPNIRRVNAMITVGIESLTSFENDFLANQPAEKFGSVRRLVARFKEKLSVVRADFWKFLSLYIETPGMRVLEAEWSTRPHWLTLSEATSAAS